MVDEAPRTAGTPASIASDLARALDDEVRRIVDIKLVGWQILGATIGAVALFITVANPAHTGWPALVGGCALVAWATFERWAAARGARWTVVVHVAIELTVPWLLLLFIAVAVGARQANEAWGPPLIYGGILMLSVVHLKFALPVINGVFGAVQYVLIYAFAIGPRLPAYVVDVHGSPEGPVGRATMILVSGLVAGFIARGLRKAIGGASRTVRARDLFGKYKLEREIAHGGMGVVHLATYCPEGGFRRPVAVKMIHPHLAREARFVDAFRNEAELCARLLHHNIVQVLDFGKVADTYFIAMELVDGTTCRGLFKRAIAAGTRVPPGVVVAIGHAILDGLYHAHHEALDDDGRPLHVIHRDLGLENILIAKTGVVKVTDFGIARALREANSALTSTVVGHSDHMAPEQANAEALDERCDLFCVGILLWELLCGRALFTRNSDAASLVAVLQAPVPAPSSQDPALIAWDPFFARALARPKESRFATANDMSAALVALAATSGADDVARFLAALPADGTVDAAVTLPVRGNVGSKAPTADDAATLVDAT